MDRIQPKLGVLRAVRSTGVAAACVALALAVAGAAFAAPPAGTPIGNQATATYLDAASVSHTVVSNLVTTTVQQVAALSLTADNNRTAAPGAPVYFPHVVTNNGNGTDDFALALSSLGGDDFDLAGIAIYADADGNGVPDDFTPLASTGSIAAGATFRFVVAGNVPGVQLGGDFALTRVTATSTFDGAQTAFNTDRVDVTGNAVLSVTKAINAPSGNSPSGPYTYTLSYTNTGNAAATAVALEDIVPAGMAYVPGSARWSVTGAGVPLTDIDNLDAQGVAPNTVVYDFGVTTGGTMRALLNQVPPGASGTLTFQVGVNAGLGPQVISNVATYGYNDGAGNVGPFATNAAPFQVNQVVTLTFSGQTIATANQGQILSFVNTLNNTGNGPDVFDIAVGASSFPPGTTWQLFQSDGVTPLTDSNGNTTPDTGPLAAGASTTVILRVALPTNATGGPFTLSKTATSAVNPLVSAVATDELTSIVPSAVDLTNDTALPGAPGAGTGPEGLPVVTNATNPGTTTRFTLYVNNTGPVADAYALGASTDGSFGSVILPPGWSVTFRDAGNVVITGTPSIAAGGNTLVYADVTVPAGFVATTADLYFRALSPTSGASDHIHDAVTVNPVRSLALVPNGNAQVVPGGTHVYAHLLANNGNVLEGDGVGSFVALASGESQAGWSSTVYWDADNSGTLNAGDPVVADLTTVGGLSPGASIRLFVQVFAPAGAPLGQVNVTSVSATTGNLGYVSPAPALAVATDNTTIINGQLQIVKRQALDATCDGTEDAPFDVLDLSSLPDRCVRYEITVTNVGTLNVTNVVVNDATPANTTFSAAGAFLSVGTLVTPADGATGTIAGTVGTLAPGQSAILRFNVRINP